MATHTKRFATVPYSNLDAKKHEIRLIHLQPRTIGHKTLHCQMTTVSLDEKPTYEALSYEWGVPESRIKSFTINVEGNQISVRRNLWWALKHLRHETEPRVLWIDALCINQGDVHERNQQVSQMRSVYSGATSVVAWIGRENTHHKIGRRSHEASIAINFLQQLSATSIKNYPSVNKVPWQSGMWGGHRVVENEYSMMWDALIGLCCGRYFKRTWIIQEIILGGHITIQCGALSVPWSMLSRVCSEIRESKYPDTLTSRENAFTQSPAFKLDTLRSMASEYQHSGLKTSHSHILVDVLAQFDELLCQDTRDKVFGVLSLCNTCCQDAVSVDYSIEPASLAAKVMVHHLLQHEHHGAKTITSCQTVLKALKLGVLGPRPAPSEFSFDCTMGSKALAARWMMYQLSQHVRNGTKTVKTKTVRSYQTGLKALKLEVPLPAHLNLSLNPIRSVARDQKVLVVTRYRGRIVWLSTDYLDTKTNKTWAAVRDSQVPDHLLRRILGDSDIEDYNLPYFNPNSDHSCNEEPSLKSTTEVLCNSYPQVARNFPARRKANGRETQRLPNPLPSPRKQNQSPADLEDKLNQVDDQTSDTESAKSELPDDPSSNFITPAMKKIWNTTRLAVFVASSGTSGLTTHNVKLGDRACQIMEDERKLAMFSVQGNACYISGKGLKMSSHHDERKPPLDKLTKRSKSGHKMPKLELKVDMATLFYLASFF